MDEKNNKDVEKKVKNTAQTVNSNFTQEADSAKSGNKSKIIIISVIAVAVALLLIAGIVALAKNLGKPSKKQAEKLVKSYIEAINEEDDEELLKMIDADGYAVFQEADEKESKFDKKYKKKKDTVEDFMDDKNLDDKDELEEYIIKNEGNEFYTSYGYEYSFKSISSVKKSSKSSKIAVIKAKVKIKTRYDDDYTRTLVLYVMKVSGKYKVIGSQVKL